MLIGSLFSGIGCLELGVAQGLAELGRPSRVIWQAEKDPYCRAVLAKHWPLVRRYEDVREIDDRTERPDIMCGGFPCQDLSIAGRRLGITGARSGLWSEYVRAGGRRQILGAELRGIRVLRPDLVFVENVPELAAHLGHVLGPLAELGYDAEWDLFDAAAVGAPHRRERLFQEETANARRAEQGRHLAVVAVIAPRLGAVTAEVLAGRRYKPAIRARWATALALFGEGLSYAAIGRLLDLDHTSVMHAVQQAGGLAVREPRFADAVEAGVAAWRAA